MSTNNVNQETGEIMSNMVESKTTKRFVDEMVYLLKEKESADEVSNTVKATIKQLKADIKKAGLDTVSITAVATAIANDKVQQLEDSTKATMEVLDEIMGD